MLLGQSGFSGRDLAIELRFPGIQDVMRDGIGHESRDLGGDNFCHWLAVGGNETGDFG